MKKFDVCGLGNALVDLLFECSDSEFEALKMKKGGMSLIDAEAQKQILIKLKAPVSMSSGGSVANSVAMIGQLGGRAALICSLAKDERGDFFKSDLAQIGVEVSTAVSSTAKQETGSSLVVVTPDAERTMSTALGASAELGPSHIHTEFISDARWVFIEGYVVANSEAAREAILALINCAKKSETKIAITMSDAFVVNGFRDFLDKILPQVDLIFCNDVEAAALSGESDTERAFEKLQSKYSGVVVTAGSKGVHVSYAGTVAHCAAFACEPVDLTGAGDAFAGAFLKSISAGFSPFEAARKGCFYASKVIQQWGARIRADMHKLQAEFAEISN